MAHLVQVKPCWLKLWPQSAHSISLGLYLVEFGDNFHSCLSTTQIRDKDFVSGVSCKSLMCKLKTTRAAQNPHLFWYAAAYYIDTDDTWM